MATILAARPLTVDLCLQIAVCLYVSVSVYVYADSHVEVPGKYNVQVDYDDYDDDDDSGSDFDEVSQRAAKSKWSVDFVCVFVRPCTHSSMRPMGMHRARRQLNALEIPPPIDC